MKELFRVSRKYLIIQSATTPLGFRIVPRKMEEVKKELYSKPFGGALWRISSIGLIRLVKSASPKAKILRIVSAPFMFPAVLFHLLRRVRNNRKLLDIQIKIDNFVSERRILNLLCGFTTILVKKTQI